MLSSNNTTISIAHRLSTIQRSDIIIVLGTDGTVAQTGSYRQLSQDKDGAFAKLMEWQMSGGTLAPPTKVQDEPEPALTEEERRRRKLEEEHAAREREESSEQPEVPVGERKS
jgi:putative ABC transport system ATP-binding protein